MSKSVFWGEIVSNWKKPVSIILGAIIVLYFGPGLIHAVFDIGQEVGKALALW